MTKLNIILISWVAFIFSTSHASSFKQGRIKSATCTSCHGAQGFSINPAWPHLNGQNKEYLYQQLLSFKYGKRKNKVMEAAVSFLSDEDLESLAVYYAELPKKQVYLKEISQTQHLRSFRGLSGVTTPESVYFEPQSKRIFVSNVVGQGAEKDGNGWIGVLSPKDQYSKLKVFKAGLDAPKGMRSINNTLWVTDIDTVYGLSLKDGLVQSKIKIDEAKFLNDVAISEKGRIFVSDTLGSAIYEISDQTYRVFDRGDHLESPNGLLWRDGKLYVAAFGLTSNWSVKIKGRIYTIDLKTKERRYITKKPFGTLDGIEIFENQIIVSDWRAGKVYSVNFQGESKVLVSNLLGSADIGIVPSKNWLIVPRMAEDLVSFFHLSGRSESQD